MPYVIRDALGKIVQVFDEPVTGAAEGNGKKTAAKRPGKGTKS